jgi:hypothetical protein
VVGLRRCGRNRNRARWPDLQLLLLLLLPPAISRLSRWERARLLILGLQHHIGVHHVYISSLCIGKKWMELAARHLIFLLLSKAESQRNFILCSQLLFVGIFFSHFSSQITYLTMSKYKIAALQNLSSFMDSVKKIFFPHQPVYSVGHRN